MLDLTRPIIGIENRTAQEVFDIMCDRFRALSTVTPAEVGGLWVPANPEHAKLGWTYDFEQTERIARAAYDSTGYDAPMEVVEFVMAEADRRHRTALTTERAAHAETKRERDEALKALEPFANVAEHDIGDDEDDSDTFWPMSNARYSMAGRLRVGHLRAARRALEAQGGE